MGIYSATIKILDRFRHTGFSVYQGPPVLPCDTASREKLAVYILHPAISLDRMSYDSSNATVDYRPKSSESHPSLPGAAQRQDPLGGAPEGNTQGASMEILRTPATAKFPCPCSSGKLTMLACRTNVLLPAMRTAKTFSDKSGAAESE